MPIADFRRRRAFVVSGMTSERAPRSLAARLGLGALLYFGPFFSYPWKPVINWFVGVPYPEAYKNFRDQHLDTSNLVLHMVCLGSQLAGNVGLLYEIDALVADSIGPAYAQASPWGLRLFSLVTLLLWLGSLGFTPAPWLVKLGSAACLAAAYFVAPLLQPVYVEVRRARTPAARRPTNGSGHRT